MATLTDIDADTLYEMAKVDPATWGFVASKQEWLPFRHLKYIAVKIMEAVRDAEKTGGGRIVVNLAPGMGKSQLISHWTPSWFLEKYPDKNVLLASHGADFAKSWGRIVRNEQTNNTFCRTKLAEDSKAASIWNTEQGGGMVTGGVGTGITGRRAHLLLLDDPYPGWAEAFSHTYRQTVMDWWESVFLTRMEPNATVVVLHHRFHPDDLTGVLMKDPLNKWDVIRMPALAEHDDIFGRLPGESLWPKRWPASELAKKRNSRFEAMYQQNPSGIATGALYSSFGYWNVESDLAPVAGHPIGLALDFNINPGMHAEIGQYFPAHDRWDIYHELHAPRMSLPECIDAFAAWYRANGNASTVEIYGDASGGAGSIVGKNQSFYDIVKDRFGRARIPHRMLVPPSNPRVFDRVQSVNDALNDGGGKSHVRVHPQCERLITDFREMRSDEQGTIDKKQQKLSHASDAFGYWVHFVRPIGGRKTERKPAVFHFANAG